MSATSLRYRILTAAGRARRAATATAVEVATAVSNLPVASTGRQGLFQLPKELKKFAKLSLKNKRRLLCGLREIPYDR
jgi:hypothetical protein